MMGGSPVSSGPSGGGLSAELSRPSRHTRIKSLPSNLLQRTSTGPVSPRRRTTIACERCRLLKARCDASWPRCSNCCKVDADCKKSYYTSGSAKQYIESLEQRCSDLEQCLDALVTRPGDNTKTYTRKLDKDVEGLTTVRCLPPVAETMTQSEACVTPMLLPHFPFPEASPPTWTWDDSMMSHVFCMKSPAPLEPEAKAQACLDVETMSYGSIELSSQLDLAGLSGTS